jgi:hypothetical protein
MASHEAMKENHDEMISLHKEIANDTLHIAMEKSRLLYWKSIKNLLMLPPPYYKHTQI